MNKLKLIILLIFVNILPVYAFETPELEYCETVTLFNINEDASDQDILKSCFCDVMLDSKPDPNKIQEFLNIDFPDPEDPERKKYTFVTQEQVDQVCEYTNLLTEEPCIYKTTSDIYQRDFIKIHDQNNNCKIDSNSEECNIRLAYETFNANQEQRLRFSQNKYGCYGDSPRPTYFEESLRRDREQNTVSVLDENEGLVATSQQRSVLINLLQTDQGGPIIGLINYLINFLVSIVFVLCMASLIYGGYNLIFAGLDSEMIEKGKNAIKYATFGFVFIMLSYTIVILIQSLF